jgi:dihydrofolate reductase
MPWEEDIMAERSKIVAIEHLSLDGVFQAPARADEDPRDGFDQGGWANATDAPEAQEVIGRSMQGGWSLLVGRTTFADLHEGWAVRQPSSPMARALTNVEKFVISRKAGNDVPWENTTLLTGEAAETVAKLKAEHDKTLIIFGSGALVGALMQHRLIDEFVLIIHPLVLGKGRRLFDASPASPLTLADILTAKTGSLIVTYRPAQ